MSDNKVTLDQLDNSAVEAMSSSVGDVNMLNTENKTIVGALAEIVGKKEIANAIGEPLAETDKFTEMSSEINGLLSTFKTNMMNAGVVVESGDKFKALIDKIKGLTEGEGNKGIQYAEGEVLLPYNAIHGTTIDLDIDYDLDFVPTLIFAIVSYDCSNSTAGGSVSKTVIENFAVSNIMDHKVDRSKDTIVGGYTNYKITNVTDKKCTLSITNMTPSTTGDVTNWYAIGVGEEDTTLRDSLASILQEEGVSVTEEDDMASLITKVDEELNNIKQNLVDALVNKGIADAGEYSFDDLINNINDFYVLRAGAGNTISVAKNTTLVTNNTTSFKLAYTSPTIGEDYLEGTYSCYCYIYTNIGGTNYAIAEAKIEHIRNESVIASATLSQPTTDTTKHSYDFKNVKRGDYFKFYIRNSVDRSYNVSMDEKGITYDEVFIKNINE